MDCRRDLGGNDSVALAINQEDSGGATKFAQIFRNAHLLRASRFPVRGFFFRTEAWARFQPVDMVVNRIAGRCTDGQLLQILLRVLQRELDATVTSYRC